MRQDRAEEGYTHSEILDSRPPGGTPCHADPGCVHFGKCGGCTRLGVPYEEQLSCKESRLRSLLEPVLQGQPVREAILPSPEPLGYRNKMEYSFGDQRKDGPLALGLHQKKSFYNILDADGCRIAPPDFGIILQATRTYFANAGIPYYHKRSHQGYLRHLLLRKGKKTGEILVDLVTSQAAGGRAGGLSIGQMADGGEPGSGGKQEYRASEQQLLAGWRDALLLLGGNLEGRIAGILHTRNESLSDAIKDNGTEILYGRDFFYEEILSLKFRISPFSFFQTNSLGAERLYAKVREYAAAAWQARGHEQKPVIYDLYSGTGTITQIMASFAAQAAGVEIVEEAVLAARSNALENGIGNCFFIAGDVLQVLSQNGAGVLCPPGGDAARIGKPDILILDPPREGVHPKALKEILAYGAEILIYISCKPESLARDLIPLQEAAYRVERYCPVDMFPQTEHVETVVLLTHD